MPLSLRLLALAVVGLFTGSLINAGIYALAWISRPISPWQRRHPQAVPSRWADFVAVIGWLGLAREAAIHGRGFWIRPLFIEICCGIGLPGLYWWEISGKLAPLLAGVMPPSAAMLQHAFVSHAILMG